MLLYKHAMEPTTARSVAVAGNPLGATMKKFALVVLLAVLAVSSLSIMPASAGQPGTTFNLYVPGGWDPITQKNVLAAWVSVPVTTIQMAQPFVPGANQSTFAAITNPERNLWQIQSVPTGTRRFVKVVKIWSNKAETLGMMDLAYDIQNEAGYAWQIDVFRPDGRQIARFSVYPDEKLGRGQLTVPVYKDGSAYTIEIEAIKRGR